jgi:hypothetical protein
VKKNTEITNMTLRPMLTVAQKSKTKMAATFDFEFF